MPRISNIWILLCVVAVLAGCTDRTKSSRDTETPVVTFYADSNAGGDAVCRISLPNDQNHLRSTFTDSGCDGARARSMRLEHVTAGLMVMLYKNDGCGDSTDHSVVTVRNAEADLIVKDFEDNGSFGSYEIKHSHHDGLDGNVSCFVVYAPGRNVESRAVALPKPGVIRFYESTNGSQDNFCSWYVFEVPYSQKGKPCKNDEAKSIKFENLPAATYVYVHDNENCDTGDDWAKIATTRESGDTPGDSIVARRPIVVWHFEDDDPDDDYLIDYHYQDGNLDGKVSCVIATAPAPTRPHK